MLRYHYKMTTIQWKRFKELIIQDEIKETLYQRIGGEAAINAVVDGMY